MSAGLRRYGKLLLLALALPGCGGGGGGGTAPTPPVTLTPGPARANISISISNPTASSGGGAPGFAYSLQFGMRLSESAGVGANLNFIRLGMYSSTGSVLEFTEKGSNEFPGGNRLEANAAREFNVTMGFNSEPQSGRFAHVGVGTTDDRGNNILALSERLYFP